MHLVFELGNFSSEDSLWHYVILSNDMKITCNSTNKCIAYQPGHLFKQFIFCSIQHSYLALIGVVG